MNLIIAQINPTVGAIAANTAKIIQWIIQYPTADIIIFPELALTGYPPEDLLLSEALYLDIEKALDAIANTQTTSMIIIGHPSIEQGLRYNSASIFLQGKCILRYDKQLLPNYGVFDEMRYFTSGQEPSAVFEYQGYILGLCICEDVWHEKPVTEAIDAKVELLIVINASPFDITKQEQRTKLLAKQSARGVAIVYVNMVGGQDELIFDGQSLAYDNTGKMVARMPEFMETAAKLTLTGQHLTGEIAPKLTYPACIYQALIMALRDYVHKNNFSSVVLGLSGGIDSALTLTIAVDALGADNVHAILMPSRYTAEISNEYALCQLKEQHVSFDILPIESILQPIKTTLDTILGSNPKGCALENIQARVRGLLLMASSNHTGRMLVSTSNKSETAVGYATLYGDMCGGFAILKDVYKTVVYELATYRNSLSNVIPQQVIERAPSAELTYNQKDQDTLPEYAVLDAILEQYIEHNASYQELYNAGFPRKIVDDVLRRVQQNEYKRHQAPIGPKITPRAFAKDWRYPITKIN